MDPQSSNVSKPFAVIAGAVVIAAMAYNLFHTLFHRRPIATKTYRAYCYANMRQLWAACGVYVQEYGGHLPDRLGRLFETRLLADSSLLTCQRPGYPKPRLRDTGPAIFVEDSGFELVNPGRPVVAGETIAVLRGPVLDCDGLGRCGLFSAGRVRWVPTEKE